MNWFLLFALTVLSPPTCYAITLLLRRPPRGQWDRPTVADIIARIEREGMPARAADRTLRIDTSGLPPGWSWPLTDRDQ